MARDVDTILGLLGITDDKKNYQDLIAKLKTTNTLTDDELQNIMNISVKPLPNVVRNQPDMLKQKMVGIVTDENLGLAAVINKRFVLFQCLIEELNKADAENKASILQSIQLLKTQLEADLSKLENSLLQEIEEHSAELRKEISNAETRVNDYVNEQVDALRVQDEFIRQEFDQRLSSEIEKLTTGQTVVEEARRADTADKAIYDINGNEIIDYYARLNTLTEHIDQANKNFTNISNVINNILVILTSNDTDLDTLQELVNALKNNVASINDLFSRIALKADKTYVDEEIKKALEKQPSGGASNANRFSIVKNLITNINGFWFGSGDYAFIEIPYEGYTVKQLKSQTTGQAILDKDIISQYMQVMSGNPENYEYSYTKPLNDYFLSAQDMSIWKMQYDSTNGLLAFKVTSLVNETSLDDKVMQIVNANFENGEEGAY